MFVALFTISSFALVSCSDDDDEVISSDIVGTWKCDFLESMFSDQYIQFKSDGQFVEVFIDKLVDWEDPEKIEVEMTRGQWRRTENTLTLIPSNDDSVTSTSEIVELTDTDLTLVTLGIPTRRLRDRKVSKVILYRNIK